MIFIPNASWLSTNSRSKRSIKISRFPWCSVYCLNSTTGQQSREERICFELSPIGSVMTHLTIASVDIKKAEAGGPSSYSGRKGNGVASKLRKSSPTRACATFVVSEVRRVLRLRPVWVPHRPRERHLKAQRLPELPV